MITQKDLDKANCYKECPDEISDIIHDLLQKIVVIFGFDKNDLNWYFPDAEEGCVGSYSSYNGIINYEFSCGNSNKRMLMSFNDNIYDLTSHMPEEWIINIPSQEDLYNYVNLASKKQIKILSIKDANKQKNKEKDKQDTIMIQSIIDVLTEEQIKCLTSISKSKVNKIKTIAKEKLKQINENKKNIAQELNFPVKLGGCIIGKYGEIYYLIGGHYIPENILKQGYEVFADYIEKIRNITT